MWSQKQCPQTQLGPYIIIPPRPPKNSVFIPVYSLSQIIPYRNYITDYSWISYSALNIIIASSPGPPSFSMLHAEKREGLGDNVTCVTFQVDVWSTYNYRAWALAVLTTATESIIDSKGALIVACLADPRLVTLANSIACHCEAFGHYRSRSRHRPNDWSKTARTIVACWSWQWRTTVLNLKFIDRLLSSLLPVSKKRHLDSSYLEGTMEQPVDSIPAVYFAHIH